MLCAVARQKPMDTGAVIMSMIERISGRIFFVCMYPCAILVFSFVWNGGPPFEWLFRVAASLFIVGLAAFLTWFVLFLHGIRRGIVGLPGK